jgi:large subunit ribosomal protein L22
MAIATAQKNNTAKPAALPEKSAAPKLQAKTAAAHARYIRISPRKMRLVTNLVKNMHAADAIQQLSFTPKKGSRIVIDLIKSAAANAENNFKMDKDNLYIKSITCDSGPKLKRYMPRAQGRATEIRRPTSHIHVILEERQGGKKRKAAIKFKAKPETAIKEAATEVVKSAELDEKNKITGRSSQIEKTGEQRKANQIQQKRRLFNRKSGV